MNTNHKSLAEYYRPRPGSLVPGRLLVWVLVLAAVLALASAPGLVGNLGNPRSPPTTTVALRVKGQGRGRTERCGPRLLVIGSQKGGTTSLYKYMKRFDWIAHGTGHGGCLHSTDARPPRLSHTHSCSHSHSRSRSHSRHALARSPGAHKELHFFDKYYQRSTKPPAELSKAEIRDLQIEYLGKFGWTVAQSAPSPDGRRCHDARTGLTFDTGGADPDTVLSDVTPRYIIVPEAAALAEQLSDDPFILALVREPASRAVSHFQMEWRERYEGDEAMLRDSDAFAEEFEKHVRQGIDVARECLESFPEVSADCHRRGMSHVADFVWRGLYALHLDPWLRQFGRDKVLLWVSEEFSADPRAHLAELQRRVWDGRPTEVGEAFQERFNVDEHVVFPKPESLEVLKEFYGEYNDALAVMLRAWWVLTSDAPSDSL